MMAARSFGVEFSKIRFQHHFSTEIQKSRIPSKKIEEAID